MTHTYCTSTHSEETQVRDEILLERITAELVGIKRLLVSALMRNGVSQQTVAKALGVNQSFGQPDVSARKQG